MSDRLILFDLVAAVQARAYGSDNWRTVAAFDLNNIADAYADKCRAANWRQFQYRVVPLEPDATKCRTGNLSVVGAGPTGLSDKETS